MNDEAGMTNGDRFGSRCMPGYSSLLIRRSFVILVWSFVIPAASGALAGFQPASQFNEQIRETTLGDVRIWIDAAGDFDSAKPTTLIIYALPNGNSIEQTVGCAEQQGLDWHYFIQQIGAQIRALRAIDAKRNVAIAYVEATVPGIGRTWPAWKAKHADSAAIIRQTIDSIVQQIPGNARIVLAAHSGGGAFLLGYINSVDAIDAYVERIAFLDANYSYNDDQHHGDKLLAWLARDKDRHLVVIAYDDRKIELNGKAVVSDTGGTWRASHRMIDRFGQQFPMTAASAGDFDTLVGMDGQITFFLNRNPRNIILHTRLVGEMNGFMTAMTTGTEHEVPMGASGVATPFAKWIAHDPVTIGSATSTGSATSQATPTAATADRANLAFPPRPADAIGGSAFIARIADLSRDDREVAILSELKKGNVPHSSRTLCTVRVKVTGDDGVPHFAEYYVMPDYLSIGSDEDFVRMPMLPATAQKIADFLACSLPTRKMVDDIDSTAALWLEPQPLVENREAPATFLAHNQLIEQQRAGRNTGNIVCGIKKDIVVTNRLKEKPNRVAIYGWRKMDGNPIQPLTIIHADTYVDYSHGVRLIARGMRVDGNETTIENVLKNPALCGLLSDEGVIEKPDYR